VLYQSIGNGVQASDACCQAQWSRHALNITMPKILSTQNGKRNTLGACCGAHILHDGYTDLLYVMFPVWQMAFGLSLAEVGSLKTLYAGVMASFQMPSGVLAERVGEKWMLVAGTLIAAAGFIASGWTAGFLGLSVCLALSGLGASVQHPIASSLTARTFDPAELRGALSVYNVSGDVGKVILPTMCAALLAMVDWHTVTILMGLLGLCVAILLAILIPKRSIAIDANSSPLVKNERGSFEANPDQVLNLGFASLASIAVIDSAARMGFLTLLPFLLMSNGASVTQVGFALSLTFVGGAAGKLVCGFLAARFGVVRTTWITEVATSILMALVLQLTVDQVFLVLPLLGVALNGTSSGLYGTVPELVALHLRARAFGIFYTLAIGAGAVAPLVFGFAGDCLGVSDAIMLIAATLFVTLPLAWFLRKATGMK
jgi:MFS family permease